MKWNRRYRCRWFGTDDGRAFVEIKTCTCRRRWSRKAATTEWLGQRPSLSIGSGVYFFIFFALCLSACLLNTGIEIRDWLNASQIIFSGNFIFGEVRRLRDRNNLRHRNFDSFLFLHLIMDTEASGWTSSLGLVCGLFISSFSVTNNNNTLPLGANPPQPHVFLLIMRRQE